MKNKKNALFVITVLATVTFVCSSCVNNLLEQLPATEVAKSVFWKSEDDARLAINGAFSSIRGPFQYEYFLDAMTDIVWTRGVGTCTLGGNYTTADQGGYGALWNMLYEMVNRANYVIINVEQMKATSNPLAIPQLDRVLAEARFLRGLAYFRLIALWGDVPYFDRLIQSNSDVSNITRTPIADIKNSIISDFSYGIEDNRLPNAIATTEWGRPSKAAALAFRGKVHLYWASWNKFGWPELQTFTPDAQAAIDSYKAARTDFKSVIDDFNLSLFRNGEPGQIGEMGKCDVLPNYYELFCPWNETDNEIIFSVQFTGPLLGQGSELLNQMGNRQTQNSQSYLAPTIRLANSYQRISTGDFAPELIPCPGNVVANRTLDNSAVNPKSYEDRDYRMKSTLLWDNETMPKFTMKKDDNVDVTWLFKTSGIAYIEASACVSGYIPRKYVRNKSLGYERNDDPQDIYLMRLADVFLMYAEADNFVDGPQSYAIELVDRIRHRAGLPKLGDSDQGIPASSEDLFAAIKQERKVEFAFEGLRYFDSRRWRCFEEIWGEAGTGVITTDTWGATLRGEYLNYTELNKERYYILKIPEVERNRNPNLTQNTPWL